MFFLKREKFKELYGGRDIDVYISNNYYWGVDAVNWAKKTYYGNEDNVKYVIDQDLRNTRKVYCSKIVVQSYVYGVGSKTLKPNLDKKNFPNSRIIISPYELPDILLIGRHGTYNGYSR